MSISTKHRSARKVQVAGQVQATNVGSEVPSSYQLAWRGSHWRAGRGGRRKGRDVVGKGAAGAGLRVCQACSRLWTGFPVTGVAAKLRNWILW